jgi:hypothetical protein
MSENSPEDKMPPEEVVPNKSSAPQQKKSSVNIEERVAQIVQVAEKHKQIEVGLIAKDGSSFLLLGKVWTPELSRVAAELAVTISSTNENWVNGGYRDSLSYPDDMRVIYKRK